MDSEEFNRRLDAAEPGHVIEYHRGAHLCDCPEIAEEARKAAQDGLVHLTQKRYGPDDYGYQAVVAADAQRSHWAEARTPLSPCGAPAVTRADRAHQATLVTRKGEGDPRHERDARS